jgi:prepilin-type N-terminal cleavage/methylation domain-containing protein
MISLKRKQSGFTIVELLIVIVVIGILAAIVITTFTGVQKKGRDADRKSDINAIYSQVEVYFAENAKYPSLAQINDGTFRDDNLKGLSTDALADPSNTGTTSLTGTAPAANSGTYQYAYVVTDDGGAACDNGAAGGADCTAFTITANLEADDTNNFSKTGSNN